jgi:hypothetical protein
MFKPALAASFILMCSLTALPQKVTNDDSDAWLGTVTSVNTGTREITVTSLDKSKPESFTGLLDEGFKTWMLDDSIKQPSISELPVGMGVRLFYETKKEKAGGQKVKVNHIYAIYFLGRDGFERLRIRLKLDPSTVVTLNQATALPNSSPLKLHLSVEPPGLKDTLAKWIEKWNREQADKYGRIELVSELGQADVSLVTFKTVVTLSERALVPEEPMALKMPSVHVFLVALKAGGLDILWKDTPPFFPAQQIEKEIERRMKARSKT